MPAAGRASIHLDDRWSAGVRANSWLAGVLKITLLSPYRFAGGA